MKVTLKSRQTLGNVSYPAGAQELPDSLYANKKFVELVQSGVISVHPRDPMAQKVQASQDARAVQRSIDAKATHQAVVDARVGAVNNKAIVGADKPITLPKSQDELEREENPVEAPAAPVQAAPAQSVPAAQAEESKPTKKGPKL